MLPLAATRQRSRRRFMLFFAILLPPELPLRRYCYYGAIRRCLLLSC